MPTRLHLDGVWPGPVTLRGGWAKATARPWNDDVADPAVRLERGSSQFLRAVAEHIGSFGSGGVFSPALYSSSTRIWSRAGFGLFEELLLMERLVDGEGPTRGDHIVELAERPDWSSLARIDRAAFDGFWRMSMAGLDEAIRATPRAAILQVREQSELAGYALVGTQLGMSFLQRVAVVPRFSGSGIGAALVRAARDWAAKSGARAMMLNVRPGNEKARRLYEREGFRNVDTRLHLMRFEI